jgi:hypothetical protein
VICSRAHFARWTKTLGYFLILRMTWGWSLLHDWPSFLLLSGHVGRRVRQGRREAKFCGGNELQLCSGRSIRRHEMGGRGGGSAAAVLLYVAVLELSPADGAALTHGQPHRPCRRCSWASILSPPRGFRQGWETDRRCPMNECVVTASHCVCKAARRLFCAACFLPAPGGLVAWWGSAQVAPSLVRIPNWA